MTAATDKEGPVIQDDALLDKIETLFREADELSTALKPSSSVKSQDVTRLPIIGSLPVATSDKQNATPPPKDDLQPLSPMAEADMMTTVVLTGIVSRPGGELSHHDTISLAEKHLESSSASSSSEDPFIAIKNAVEIAGRSDNNNNNLASEPAKRQSASQTSDLAHALAEIIKQQIDTAIETRIAASQATGKKQTSGNSDNDFTLKKSHAPNREAAKSALKKAAKIAQRTKKSTTTSKPAEKAKPITKTSAKNTQKSKKPDRKQTKKTTGAADD